MNLKRFTYNEDIINEVSKKKRSKRRPQALGLSVYLNEEIKITPIPVSMLLEVIESKDWALAQSSITDEGAKVKNKDGFLPLRLALVYNAPYHLISRLFDAYPEGKSYFDYFCIFINHLE